MLIGRVTSVSEGYSIVKETLKNGSALKKFREMLIAQNVSPSTADQVVDLQRVTEILPKAKHVTEIKAPSTGKRPARNSDSLLNSM